MVLEQTALDVDAVHEGCQLGKQEVTDSRTVGPVLLGVRVRPVAGAVVLRLHAVGQHQLGDDEVLRSHRLGRHQQDLVRRVVRLVLELLDRRVLVERRDQLIPVLGELEFLASQPTVALVVVLAAGDQIGQLEEALRVAGAGFIEKQVGVLLHALDDVLAERLLAVVDHLGTVWGFP